MQGPGSLDLIYSNQGECFRDLGIIACTNVTLLFFLYTDVVVQLHF